MQLSIVTSSHHAAILQCAANKLHENSLGRLQQHADWCNLSSNPNPENFAPVKALWEMSGYVALAESRRLAECPGIEITLVHIGLRMG